MIHRHAVLAILLLFVATACTQHSANQVVLETPDAAVNLEDGTATAVPPEPTDTPAPTNTPAPTATPAPTSTPAATPTPAPTATVPPPPTEPPNTASPDEVFVGLQPFTYAGAETLEDLNDIMSDYLPIDIDEVVSNPILYRYYYTEGQAPPTLNQDICPGDFYTAWYSFETGSSVPIRIGMTVEVNSTSDEYLSWFSPIYMDEYADAAGNPTFDPPLYVAMCLDPQNRHSHTVFLSNESMNLDVPVTCRIVVNDNGQLIDSVGLGPEWSDVTGTVNQTCWHDEE